MNNFLKFSLLLIGMLNGLKTMAQPGVEWSELPVLPGGKGWAGMYAGVSNNTLICMGGANFPDKFPWEGGLKKWYSDIYILRDGKEWIKSEQKLPVPAGYGVAVSYQNKMIVAGGSNADGHLSRVCGFEWDGEKLLTSDYPALPVPLANMSGTLVGDMFVIAGGSSAPTGQPLKKCFVLDLKNPATGWSEVKPWPGPERIFPVCTVFGGHFYMFGGETTGLNSKGEKYRAILLDSYRLSLHRTKNSWAVAWEKLAPMPRGMSAGGTVLPVLRNDRFLFWGGVDAVTALHKNPATHPGIIDNLLYYFPKTDSWEYIGKQTNIPSRVTLPVVFWKERWVYVSGEIKPGIRTPTVVGVQ